MKPVLTNNFYSFDQTGLIFLSLILLFLDVSSVAQSNVKAAARDRVHYGDVVDIDVIGSFDFDWRGGLTPEGFLDGFDKIEDQIYALCRSETELAELISSKYSRILRDPNVRVRIIDRTKRPSALLTGAVAKPQRYSINRSVKLTELIVLSGGITDLSSGEISIFRPPGASCTDTATEVDANAATRQEDNSPQTFNIKISDLLNGEAASNPYILGGDLVTFVKAVPVYVIGGVNNPSSLTFRTGTSLSRAIAMAGGLSKGAIAGDITLFRKSDLGIEVKKFDLNAIESGKAEDIELRPYDVVEVGVRGRAARTQPPVIDVPDQNEDNSAKIPLYIID